MKKFLLIIILIFVFSSFFVSLFLVRNRLDSRTNGEEFIQIDKPFEFFITPINNNLNILIIHLKNPNLINTSGFSLKIFDKDEQIREFIFSGENVGDPSDLKFQFEPIEVSKNVRFKVQISSDDYQNPISIYTDLEKNPFYRLYYRSRGGVSAFYYWINEWKVKLRNNLWFFMAWGTVFAGIIYFGEKNEKK